MYPVSEAFLVPAGGAREHPEILLDGEDYHSRRRGVSL